MNFGAALSASAIFSASVTGKRSAVVWAPAVSAAKRQSTISFISHPKKNVLAVQLSSRRAVLCSGLLEELYQRLVEQSWHGRWLCLWEFAEECRRQATLIIALGLLVDVPVVAGDGINDCSAFASGKVRKLARSDASEECL
jgi:hypothetical protein